MEFIEICNYCLYIILTMITPVIAKYAVELMKTKIKESNIIADATKNEELSKIVEGAFTDVMDSILYVNQVYTDSLKANGQFNHAAQEEAFNRAYVEAVHMISDETKKVIEQLYGSFDHWLKQKIESCVNVAKKQQGA